MKYYSETLRQFFSTEAECEAAEAKHAENQKEKPVENHNDQANQLIETYERKYTALNEQYRATQNLIKEIVEQQDALERQQNALDKRRVCLNQELRDIARNIQLVQEKLETLKSPENEKERERQKIAAKEFAEVLEMFCHEFFG